MIGSHGLKFGAAALMMAAAGALAQPANDLCTDAVDLTSASFPYVTIPVDISTAAVAAEVVPSCGTMSYTIWYKMVANDNGTIEIATCLADAPNNTVADTVVSIFESADGSCGTLTQLACNDDFCDGLKSRTSAACTSGVTYYVQVGKYNTALPPAGANMELWVNAPVDRSVPGGTGQSSPGAISNCNAAAVLFTVATLPVENPPSTGITVRGDLSNVGGSSDQQFFDNGTNGDVTAGDGTFSYAYTVPAGTASGNPNLPVVVRDAEGRVGSSSLPLTITECPPADVWIEVGDAGDLPASAQVPTGSGSLNEIRGSTLTGGTADMYLIDICSSEEFSASTVGTTTIDTQLWLFNLDGTGVVFDDDAPAPATGLQSRITNAFVFADGQYYLAISGYDNDPNDGDGQAMWLDTPFGVERAPDGPGAFGSVSSWSGGGAAGNYVILMTGVCFPGGGDMCPACAADFNQDGGVDGSDVEAFFTSWESGESCGDVNQDGGVDGSDVEAFFVVWEAGGC